MEVCEDQAVAQLHRRGQYNASAFQHDTQTHDCLAGTAQPQAAGQPDICLQGGPRQGQLQLQGIPVKLKLKLNFCE